MATGKGIYKRILDFLFSLVGLHRFLCSHGDFRQVVAAEKRRQHRTGLLQPRLSDWRRQSVSNICHDSSCFSGVCSFSGEGRS